MRPRDPAPAIQSHIVLQASRQPSFGGTVAVESYAGPRRGIQGERHCSDVICVTSVRDGQTHLPELRFSPAVPRTVDQAQLRAAYGP